MKIPLPVLLSIVLLPFTGCRVQEPPFYESHLQFGNPLQDIRYGYHGDQLLFVVFQTSATLQSHTEIKTVRLTASREGAAAKPQLDHWIELPDGTRTDLPGSRMMFEYNLGAFTNRPVDVTLEEFRGFLASRPQKHAIAQLEEFVAQQRKRP